MVEIQGNSKIHISVVRIYLDGDFGEIVRFAHGEVIHFVNCEI